MLWLAWIRTPNHEKVFQRLYIIKKFIENLTFYSYTVEICKIIMEIINLNNNINNLYI